MMINFVGLSRISNKKIVLIYIFYIFVNNTFTFRKFSFVLTQLRMLWGILTFNSVKPEIRHI